MSLVYCKKHGETGGNPYVSKLLQTAVLRNKRVEYVKLTLDYYDNDMIFDSVSYYLVKNEMPEPLLNLDVYSIRNKFEEEYIETVLLPLFEGGGVCSKCFKEWVGNEESV
ncbi:hypothetical protein AAEU31_05715 [Pseudoalteromonas sp. SSMSWG5]|uniref:hypothetical protein n=1 Tax=Pseudoalteromonas sp. SSMSWG5 TaxID=3139396 RepID=UPI003BABBE8D